jgi:hypothetical protein
MEPSSAKELPMFLLRTKDSVTAETIRGVYHNASAHRFEAMIEGNLARADYRLEGKVMRILRTEIPGPLEGRGIAAELVRAALDHARTHGMKVLPNCSYVRAYMRGHPETHSLLPAGINA